MTPAGRSAEARAGGRERARRGAVGRHTACARVCQEVEDEGAATFIGVCPGHVQKHVFTLRVAAYRRVHDIGPRAAGGGGAVAACSGPNKSDVRKQGHSGRQLGARAKLSGRAAAARS